MPILLLPYQCQGNVTGRTAKLLYSASTSQYSYSTSGRLTVTITSILFWPWLYDVVSVCVFLLLSYYEEEPQYSTVQFNDPSMTILPSTFPYPDCSDGDVMWLSVLTWRGNDRWLMTDYSWPDLSDWPWRIFSNTDQSPVTVPLSWHEGRDQYWPVCEYYYWHYKLFWYYYDND